MAQTPPPTRTGTGFDRRQAVLLTIFVAISIAFELAALAVERSAPIWLTVALIVAPAVLAIVVAVAQRGGWLRFLVHGFTERPHRGRWWLAPRTDRRD